LIFFPHFKSTVIIYKKRGKKLFQHFPEDDLLAATEYQHRGQEESMTRAISNYWRQMAVRSLLVPGNPLTSVILESILLKKFSF
uniref:SNF2_N domain-containing protein n=1 Tax=Elaeophora elaphi TaxID=1147741 RepID=A0A0R3RQG5_9BILA